MPRRATGRRPLPHPRTGQCKRRHLPYTRGREGQVHLRRALLIRADLPQPLSLRYRGVAGLLIIWATFLLATHLGPRSPYTPGTEKGRIANPDAQTVQHVTRFFYDGVPPNYASAHNLKLPLHSFVTATVGAFVRPYLAANYLANALALALLICCAVRLGATWGLAPAPLLVALATILALPPFVGYAGQPMHYVVGTSANFLLVMAAIAMTADELRRPVTAGVILALYAIAYDPYVFLFAFILLFAHLKFERRRDDVIFLSVALAPPVVWHVFLRAISGGEVSDDIRERFMYAVIVEWSAFFEAPLERILQPFVVSHVGAHVAMHQVIAMIYWPVLLGGIAALWTLRPQLNGHHVGRLTVLLVAVYFVEQLVTAAFDWENNPRRALPVVLAFALVYAWAAHKLFGQARWRRAFVALLLLTGLLATIDVTFRRNGLGPLYQGEAIRQEPKVVLRYIESKVPVAPVPVTAERMLMDDLPRAQRAPTPAFLFAQLFMMGVVVAYFWVLARARLLPPYAPAVAAAVILASGVRFVV